MTRLVLLDDEAVQALMATDHPKHRRALAHVAVVGARKKKAATVDLAVPTAVRVEAGWDRTAPAAALINLLRIRDAALDTDRSDAAAALVSQHGVASPCDGPLGPVEVRLWPCGSGDGRLACSGGPSSKADDDHRS